ncbi:MAG: hypothetical protein HW383_676 [Candidatus Magasanikbacteria bacterium]|nr:hypothetical protein [Candidatus Magasanikbacteria bacterium]
MSKKEGFSKKEIGALGERMAAEFLTRHGYKILARNFFCRVGEIDIVARSSDGAIVFVEIKTRSGVGFGAGEEAIDWRKIRKMRRAAAIFLSQFPAASSELRFDSVSVALNWQTRRAKVRHIEGVTA